MEVAEHRVDGVLMAKVANPTGTQGVKSAMRTLDLIEYVVARSSGVIAQEIAAALAIPVSSLSYLLATLVDRSYLRREGRLYYAGEGLKRLGGLDGEHALVDRARPLVKALRQQLNETVSLFTRIDWEVEAVITEVASQTLRYSIEVGTRAPLHCVAAGKAVLAAMPDDQLDLYFAEARFERFTECTICDPQQLRAQLEEIRRTGYAFARDEYTLGITAISRVIGITDSANSAISVGVPSLRMTQLVEQQIMDLIGRSVDALNEGDLWVQSASNGA